MSEHIGYLHLTSVDSIRHNIYLNGKRCYYTYKDEERTLVLPTTIFVNLNKTTHYLDVTLDPPRITYLEKH